MKPFRVLTLGEEIQCCRIAEGRDGEEIMIVRSVFRSRPDFLGIAGKTVYDPCG